MSHWTEVKDAAGLLAYWNLVAEIDLAFATTSRRWWASRTVEQLRGLVHGAWSANDKEQYMLARSYLASREVASTVSV